MWGWLSRIWFFSGCLGKYCKRCKLRKKLDSFSFAILKNYFFRSDLLLKFPFKGFSTIKFNIKKTECGKRTEASKRHLFSNKRELFVPKSPTFNSIRKLEKEYWKQPWQEVIISSNPINRLTLYGLSLKHFDLAVLKQ